MLRASIRSSRLISCKPIAAGNGHQWHAARAGRVVSGGLRSFADIKKSSLNDSKPIVLPGSASDATSEPVPQGPVITSPSSKLATEPLTPATPAEASIAPENVPLTPPPPPAQTETAAPTSLPPPPAPKPKRRIRRFLTTLLILSALGFGGGVYYSRINDNFHDFFTEYVPFGEDAVLYFEERDFRRKFPLISNRAPGRPRDTGDQVRIPSQSGVSWKISDATKPEEKKAAPKQALHSPTEAKQSEQAKAVESVKKDAPAAPSPESKPVAKAPEPKPVAKAPEPKVEPEPKTSPNGVSFRAPEVDEPSKFPPTVTRIDPINIKDANEPLVQDLVKIINDIITVINADNSNSKFSATIGKAKDELSKVGGKIRTLKDASKKDAEAQVKSSHEDFDRAAKELVRRLESEMHDQESRWKEEYESERQKIQQSYEKRLKAEIDRANEVNEQRLKNQLLEQAVSMKEKFISEVKDRVEEERNGRLGKLSDLSNTVNELEKLTTDWNSVIDTNLKTQHLHVAVEAVRANLEKTQIPRPFTKELAALKEIASDDAVVNAAIASINPTAYQRGIPSSAQLIDRFRRVASEVRKASLLPEEAGVASHASSYVLSKLLFKKKGLATGNDVESILTRTETFLEEGDLDGAAREMNGLNGWAKTLSRDWLGEVRKVLEVQQALDVIATEARLQSLRVE
ncbi:mitofilin [Phlyctema vagabunda]|uniref:MICOS complex subunit MIC60 n=1 Tax=Phlyctema vagabunda TaxID=108571 RepID=A0ABR4PVQ1_9HELO